MYRVLCPFFRPEMLSPGDCMVPLTYTWCTCVGRCCGAFTKWAAVLPHSVNTPWWGHSSGSLECSTLKARGCGGCITQVSNPKRWHQWRVPQYHTLKYPCNPPPPPQRGDRHLATAPPPPRGRPSRAMGGDFKGGECTMICLHMICWIILRAFDRPPCPLPRWDPSPLLFASAVGVQTCIFLVVEAMPIPTAVMCS